MKVIKKSGTLLQWIFICVPCFNVKAWKATHDLPQNVMCLKTSEKEQVVNL